MTLHVKIKEAPGGSRITLACLRSQSVNIAQMGSVALNYDSARIIRVRLFDLRYDTDLPEISEKMTDRVVNSVKSSNGRKFFIKEPLSKLFVDFAHVANPACGEELTELPGISQNLTSNHFPIPLLTQMGSQVVQIRREQSASKLP